MLCTNYTIIPNYIHKGFLSLIALVLFITAVPFIGPVVAETGENIIQTEEVSFPISDDSEPQYEKYVVATAYSSDPWQTDSTPCLPAMQFDLCKYFENYGIEDTIAANFLALGTQVRFPELYGDKIFVVRDRMNARYNGANRIDFWIGSVTPDTQEIISEAKNKAKAFGVKQIKMEVYSK
jgi:3D (Asp-Asp-Asp) domain-containing protein